MRLLPLNFFAIHGTLCCTKMPRKFYPTALFDNFFCYQACSMMEANVLIIWGSLSGKSAYILCNKLESMLKNRFIIHVRGCSERIDNQHSLSSLSHILSINSVFSNCNPKPEDFKRIIHEARRCLIA